MRSNDLNRVVAEQQELLVRIKPAGPVSEQIFGHTHSLSCDDDETQCSVQSGNYTDVNDVPSVASVEDRLRDILHEQLTSVEEEKEKRRIERINAAEHASTKFYVTHDYLPDGLKLFDATEVRVPHADKHIPSAIVKEIAPGEYFHYK